MTPEGEVQKEILDWLSLQHQRLMFFRSKGATGYKRRIMRGPGWLQGTPDIIIILRGSTFIGIEIKARAGRNRIETSQKEFQAMCRLYNVFFFVVRSVEEVQKVIEDVTNEIKGRFTAIEIPLGG